jgi:hypothetical protein
VRQREPIPLELVRQYLKERRVSVSMISLKMGPNYSKHERFYVNSHRYPSCRIVVTCHELVISVEWLIGNPKIRVPFNPEVDMDIKICDESREEFSLYDPESLQKIYEAVTDDRIRVAKDAHKPS